MRNSTETVMIVIRCCGNFVEMKKMRSVPCRALAIIGFLAVATVGLSACNTLAGVGQDTSALGHDVSKGATSTQGAVTSSTGLANH